MKIFRSLGGRFGSAGSGSCQERWNCFLFFRAVVRLPISKYTPDELVRTLQTLTSVLDVEIAIWCFDTRKLCLRGCDPAHVGNGSLLALRLHRAVSAALRLPARPALQR